jgi:peptidase E
MTTRRIVATSGGFLPRPDGRSNARVPGRTVLEALRLCGKDRPRVLLMETAGGDNDTSYALKYQALGTLHADPDHLALFPMPNQPVEEALGRADVVWVGGGSVANLVSCWRLHGVDAAMRDAWERGVVLAGVSAGSICWHLGGTTDSYGPVLRPITDALGLLPYGNGVHYDNETQRRPLVHSLVADGTLPTTYCTDDRVGILYEGTEAVEVITDEEVDPERGPAAYRVTRVDGAAVETRLAPGRIG